MTRRRRVIATVSLAAVAALVPCVRAQQQTFRAFADGAAMVDGPAYGRITFGEYLA